MEAFVWVNAHGFSSINWFTLVFSCLCTAKYTSIHFNWKASRLTAVGASDGGKSDGLQKEVSVHYTWLSRVLVHWVLKWQKYVYQSLPSLHSAMLIKLCRSLRHSYKIRQLFFCFFTPFMEPNDSHWSEYNPFEKFWLILCFVRLLILKPLYK